MTIESKRIAKNTGLLYIRMLLLMVVSLYTSRILLSALGVVDFGLYNVVGGVVVMLGFLQGTMSTASARFITVALSHGNIDYMKRVFSSIFLINVFLALFVIIISETFGLWFLLEKMTIPPERLTASIWVYQISMLSVAVNIVTVPFNASIIAHERMGAFAYISLFDAFAKILIVYLIIISNYDRLILYSVLVFIVQTFDVVIYYIYCFKKFQETKTKLLFDKYIVKEILNFIAWASYGSFVSVGFTQGLNIVLNLFFGPTVNAARGIAVQVQNAVVNFTNNFQTAINPQLIKSTALKKYDEAQNLLIASSKYSFFLLCVLGLPIIIEAPIILDLWLKEIPENSVLFCRVIIIISIWSSLANPLRIVNQAEGNIKRFQVCECTLLLLIVPLSFFALKVYPIPVLVFVIHLIIEFMAQIVRILIVLPKIRMSFHLYIKQVYQCIIPVFFFPLLFGYYLQKGVSTYNIWGNFFVLLVSEFALFLTICSVGLKGYERSFIITLIKRNMIFNKIHL